jgi:hypothetical protein
MHVRHSAYKLDGFGRRPSLQQMVYVNLNLFNTRLTARFISNHHTTEIQIINSQCYEIMHHRVRPMRSI